MGVNLRNKYIFELNSYEVKTQSEGLDFDARIAYKVSDALKARSLTSQSTLRLPIDVLQTNKRWYIPYSTDSINS